LRAIHCHGFSVGIDLPDSCDALDLKIELADAHLLHRLTRLLGDHLRRDAGVDDCVVGFGHIIIHDRRLVVNDRDVVVRHMVVVQSAMPQMSVVAVGEPAVA